MNICYENPFTSTNNVDLQDGTFKIAVPAIALDKWFSKNEYKTGNTPFLIKIDVEGAEEDVIIGGKNTLESAQFILTEMHKTRRALDLLMTTHEIVYDACCSADTWILILKKKTQIKRPYH